MQLWLQKLKPYVVLLNIERFYKVGELIGKGNFASVFDATNPQAPGARFAIKTIDKSIILQSKRNIVSIRDCLTI